MSSETPPLEEVERLIDPRNRSGMPLRKILVLFRAFVTSATMFLSSVCVSSNTNDFVRHHSADAGELAM